ncbi:MAG TPA: hypothetical protein VND40_00245 [Nitrososphaerales archaeon]|nr:hypothetical protein [Nitrososphaerales archaeon]
MVELIEYVIVFGISAGVAGASVMLVDWAMPGLNGVAAMSKSDQVAGAARIAVIEGGNVTLTLPLQDSSVSCAAGSLSVSIDGASRAYEVGFPCSFDFQGLNGACTLFFSAPADALQLGVAC